MKDFITCYVDVNHKYTTEIRTSKILKMTPSGSGEWTTIDLEGGESVNVHHTPQELKMMMGAS